MMKKIVVSQDVASIISLIVMTALGCFVLSFLALLLVGIEAAITIILFALTVVFAMVLAKIIIKIAEYVEKKLFVIK